MVLSRAGVGELVCRPLPTHCITSLQTADSKHVHVDDRDGQAKLAHGRRGGRITDVIVRASCKSLNFKLHAQIFVLFLPSLTVDAGKQKKRQRTSNRTPQPASAEGNVAMSSSLHFTCIIDNIITSHARDLNSIGSIPLSRRIVILLFRRIPKLSQHDAQAQV